MKKIFFLALVSLIFMSFNKVQNKKIIPAVQLKFIKEKYNWNSENLLIINFVHSEKNCFYDNNSNLSNSVKWWKKFYSAINLTEVLNIYVYSDKRAARRIIDSETKFEDFENLLLNIFFIGKKQCYGILVINPLGEYEIKEGEYTEKEVENFIKTLKK